MSINKKISPRIFAGLEINCDINFDVIVKLVCSEFNVEKDKVISDTRVREFLEPRQVIQYLCRKFVKVYRVHIRTGKDRRITLTKIAELTKVTNHATVISSIKAVNNRIDTENDFKKRIEAIEALINEYNLIADKNK